MKIPIQTEYVGKYNSKYILVNDSIAVDGVRPLGTGGGGGGGGGGGNYRDVCVSSGGMCCSSGLSSSRCVCSPGENAGWLSASCGPNNQNRYCRCSTGGGSSGK